MKKILIYDDEVQFQRKWKQDLDALSSLKDFEIKPLSQEAFEGSMDVLKKRRQRLRKNDEWGDERIPLDNTSVFIIDYDLLDTDPFLTGEAVAYLVRCFSECGLIIGVNQYPDLDFDLSLKGHPESFADLNVTAKQLSNPNLWDDTRVGFRPWYWPVLPKHLCDFEKKVIDVRQSLSEDMPICQILGFSPDLFDMLPRSIGQFIGHEPARATFREFVTKSGNGLRSKDAEHVNDDILARVGAARISKWLERLVLPELDILVDAPHLVSRYPSLMTGNIARIETWNKTIQLASHQYLGLSTNLIEPFRLKKDHWLSRPVWFWDRLRECEGIAEIREPSKTVQPDWIFCEDISQFWQGDHREFVADTESPFARRFVKALDGIEYHPKVRFSL